MASVYTARAAIIRKIPVSLHLLPTYVPMVEFFLWAVASGLLLGFCLAVGHPLTLAWLMLPLLCVSTLLLAYGLGLLLAALSLFAPDLRPASALSIQLVFWLTPIVYLADILPPWLAGLMRYHPVYWTIAPAQHIVLHGRVGSLQPVLWQLMVAVLLIGVAAWVVRRLEKDIRDLL